MKMTPFGTEEFVKYGGDLSGTVTPMIAYVKGGHAVIVDGEGLLIHLADKKTKRITYHRVNVPYWIALEMAESLTAADVLNFSTDTNA